MDISELLVMHAGMVSRSQLREVGITTRTVPTPGGRLVAVRHDAYVDGARYDRAGSADRLAWRVAAAARASSVPLVAVGATAAALHGLPVLGGVPEQLELAERKQARARHHGASTTFAEHELVQVRGVTTTGLARTAMDLSRGRGFCAGVLATDAALRLGATTEQLQGVLASSARWPGVVQARAVAAFADARSESALESLGRVRFFEQGLPAPDLQIPVHDADGLIGRADQGWKDRRTVAEADGRLKYLTPDDLFEEKRREDRMRDTGLEFVRYTWDEALRRPAILAGRVLRAFARAERG